MRTLVALLVSALTASVAAADMPPTRVVWSPNGRVAAVLGGDGLRITDDSGKLSDVIMADADAIAWMDDSSRMIVAHTIKVKSWKEIKALASPWRSLRIGREADALLRLVSPAPANWATTQPTTSRSFSKELGQALRQAALRSASFDPAQQMALLHLLEDYEHVLAEAAGDQWKEVRERIAAPITAFDVVSIDSKTGATEAKRIGTSLDQVVQLEVRPDGKAFAWTAQKYATFASETLPWRLNMMSLDGKAFEEVAQIVSTIAWSQDGKHLLSARVGSGMYLNSGTVSMDHVTSERGELLDDIRSSGGAWLLTHRAQLCIGRVGDGVVFQSESASIPGTTFIGGDGDEQYVGLPDRLFRYDADRNVVKALLPDKSYEAVGQVDYFQVSPDGKRILAVAGGYLAVVWLDNGAVLGLVGQPSVVSAPRGTSGTGGRLGTYTMPVWRSNDEICFVANTHHRPGSTSELFICRLPKDSTGKVSRDIDLVSISKNWPQSVRAGLLDRHR
jgi:hypothetical protein